MRDDWILRLTAWKAEELVFVDESAANERSADRKYGWAPLGKTPIQTRLAKRSQRWSILPAITMHGYLVWDMVQASYTTESFNDFIINQVLPLCSPYPGPRSFIIMDNARIHRSEVSS